MSKSFREYQPEQGLREREQRAAETGRPLRGKRPAAPDPAAAQPQAKAVVNLTDSESRIMREGGSSGFVQGFNAQAAVDGHGRIIVAADVTNQQGDPAQPAPLLQQVEQTLGAKPQKVSADRGYYSPPPVWPPSLTGVDLYGKPDDPPKRHQRPAAASGPYPPRLPKRKWRLRCGYDSDGVPRIDRLRAKPAGPEGQAIYKKRREVAGPVFGQIKPCRRLRQFLLRGLAKAGAEGRLICLTHNLLKLLRAGGSPQRACRMLQTSSPKRSPPNGTAWSGVKRISRT